MTKPFRRTTIAAAVSGLALALGAGQAFGSAFALAEQNVMGLGNAFAGAAATAEDANTVWHNPAGLARLYFPQVETAIHVVIPSAKFQNANSQTAFLQPLGGTGGDAGGPAFVPNLYGSMAITDRVHVGIGINAPFGLKTEYDDGWLGRYQALKSEVKTINVNPAISYKVTDQFWIGAGANYQHFEATLTNNSNYSAALAQGYRSARRRRRSLRRRCGALSVATAGLDTFTKVTGDDSAWGWNVGAMLSFNGDANNDPGAGRIGLAYRSKMKYNVVGSVNFTNPTPPTLTGPLAPLNPVVGLVSAAVNQTRTLQQRSDARCHAAGLGVALVLSKGRRQVGLPGRRQLDGLEQHPGTADPAHERQRASGAAGELQGHVALLGGGQLQLRREDRAAGRRRLRSVAGQQRRPRAASARQRPHVADHRRPIQVLVRAQLRCRRAVTSSSRIPRSTVSPGSLAYRPALLPPDSSTASTATTSSSCPASSTTGGGRPRVGRVSIASAAATGPSVPRAARFSLRGRPDIASLPDVSNRRTE